MIALYNHHNISKFRKTDNTEYCQGWGRITALIYGWWGKNEHNYLGKLFDSVWDGSGCRNKMPQTRWLRGRWNYLWPCLFFLHSFGVGKSKIRVLACSVSGESFWCKWPPSCCVLTWQRVTECSGGSSYKDAIPIKSVLHFMTLFNLITSLLRI